VAVYEYRGLFVASGKNTHGVRDADNPKALRASLKRDGILLTEAHEESSAKKKGGGEGGVKAFFSRVGTADIAMMTRQLATLVAAGIPLVEAVSALNEQMEKEALRRVLSNVRDRLNEGSSLAKALEQHPKIFPPLYYNMVAAGEASGTLESVLARLADFMENQARLKGKVGAALAYPVLMLIFGSALMTLMMIVVVPKVTGIFASLDRALPWYTAVLIFVSSTLASNPMLGFVTGLLSLTFLRQAIAKPQQVVWTIMAILSALCLVGFGFMVESVFWYGAGIAGGIAAGFLLSWFLAFLRTPNGRLWKDGWLLKLPLFGPIFRMLAVSRFSQTLATLLKSGVPLLKAMEITRLVLDNAALAKVVEDAASQVREGESIAQPLKRSGQFPPIVTHMIAVGEKSGQLEAMLENVARAYDAQVEVRVAAMTSLLEPIIIIFMGGGVGFIAFSILMPLIQMNDFVQ
jgi:general secretion pathway protein F